MGFATRFDMKNHFKDIVDSPVLSHPALRGLDSFQMSARLCIESLLAIK